MNLLLAVLLYALVAWTGKQEPAAVLATPVQASLAAEAGLKAGDRVLASRTADTEEWRDVVSFADLFQSLGQAAVEGQSLQLLVGKEGGSKRQEVLLELSHLGEGAQLDRRTVQRIGLRGGYAEPVMGEIKADGAAFAAGLQKGDRVLLVDDQAVIDAAWLRDRIRAHVDAPAPMRWTIERGGQRLSMQVSPRVSTEGDVRFGKVEAFIGAAPSMVEVSYGLLEGFERVPPHIGTGAEMASFPPSGLEDAGRQLLILRSYPFSKNLSGPPIPYLQRGAASICSSFRHEDCQ
ncbi:MAG: site-2 protease family protein [Ideonella sp.]|nr:site-2 protease family protein [Ideonella sp.]